MLELELEKRDISVWVDRSDLKSGEPWMASIDQGLVSCPVVLVVLSANSAQSEYVTYEWAYAIGSGKCVIPLLIEEESASWSIHPRLKALQYRNFVQQIDGPWSALFEDIERTIKSGSHKPKTETENFSRENVEEILASALAMYEANRKQKPKPSEDDDARSPLDVLLKPSTLAGAQKKKGAKVLWVDDRPDNNIHERKMFEAFGVQFELSTSTQNALEKLGTEEYSAIISDMGRKEGSLEGYNLLKQLRAKDKETPYFIYAGSNSAEHKREAISKGAQGSTNRPDNLLDMVMASIGSTD